MYNKRYKEQQLFCCDTGFDMMSVNWFFLACEQAPSDLGKKYVFFCQLSFFFPKWKHLFYKNRVVEAASSIKSTFEGFARL